MVSKTNDEIYVSVSIGKYIVAFLLKQPLENSLPLCKCGRKCKNKVFNQSLLYPVVCYKKGNSNFFWSSFTRCSLEWRVGCIMNMWRYQHWNTYCTEYCTGHWNTTLDIYLLFKNGHKNTQTRCKVY